MNHNEKPSTRPSQGFLKWIKRLPKIVSFTVFGIVGLGTITHSTSRHKITSIAHQSQEYFTHEDEFTTKIINHITGQVSLSEKESEELMALFLSERYEVLTGEKLGDPTKIHFTDILKKMVEKIPHDLGDKTLGELENEVREELARFQNTQKNPQLYKGLWKMGQESGSPRVRILSGLPSYSRIYLRSQELKKLRPHYDYITNTVFVPIFFCPPEEIIRCLVAETSHAWRAHNHPVSSRLQGLGDVGMGLMSILGGDGEHYERTYDIPGHEEYITHRLVEPYLREKFLPKK